MQPTPFADTIFAGAYYAVAYTGIIESMKVAKVTREQFLEDRIGRAFADVANDPEQPFAEVLAFFNDPDRQLRMEDSEIHHDRPPLAGVVRELESLPAVDNFLSSSHTRRNTRLRQAIGALVGIIMQHRGWRKTGRKGSLGVRAKPTGSPSAHHNNGGLAFWFIRAERYELAEGMPFRSVRIRSRELSTRPPVTSRIDRRRKKGSANSG